MGIVYRPEVDGVIRRRIGLAQILYGAGFLISLLPTGTYPAIAWIVLVQLNFAVAPRVWFLRKI
jgi:hypothetical protein